MKFKEFGFESVEEGDGGEITAYASTFDREPDSYGDVVAKGAFVETLKRWAESGNRIPLLFGHDTRDPWMNIGAITAAEEDERGLKVTAKFDESNDTAQYVRKLVVEKRVTKLSFAYDVLEAAEVTLDDGRKAHELRKLDLFEVSIVPIPANSHAEVIDAKARSAKEGRVISKATGDAIDEVKDIISKATDELSKAIAALDALKPSEDDQDESNPENGGDEVGDNGEAKSSDLFNRIENILKKGNR